MELRLFAQETPANPPRKDLEEVAGEKDVWTAFNCFSCHKYHAGMQLENKQRKGCPLDGAECNSNNSYD